MAYRDPRSKRWNTGAAWKYVGLVVLALIAAAVVFLAVTR